MLNIQKLKNFFVCKLMELGQIVCRRGVSLPYRLFGVGSIHLRGGESFLVLLLFFEALDALYIPCMLCGF